MPEQDATTPSVDAASEGRRIGSVNQIALLCQTEEVDDTTCSLIARACNAQAWHLAADWGIVPWQVVYYQNHALVPPDADRLWILSEPNIANALGYHDKDPYGHPYGRVFWHPIRDRGGYLLHGNRSLAVTCSHESTEMQVDAPATYWSEMPDGSLVALEVADPVEDDAYDVKLTTGETVSVSNYVTPNWFCLGSVPPYDHMGLCKKPFDVLSGGYLILMAGGVVTQKFGDAYPEWRRALKTGRSRTARRIALKGRRP